MNFLIPTRSIALGALVCIAISPASHGDTILPQLVRTAVSLLPEAGQSLSQTDLAYVTQSSLKFIGPAVGSSQNLAAVTSSNLTGFHAEQRIGISVEFDYTLRLVSSTARLVSFNVLGTESAYAFTHSGSLGSGLADAGTTLDVSVFNSAGSSLFHLMRDVTAHKRTGPGSGPSADGPNIMLVGFGTSFFLNPNDTLRIVGTITSNTSIDGGIRARTTANAASSLVFSTAVVPEPSSLALTAIGGGLFAIGLIGRKHRRPIA